MLTIEELECAAYAQGNTVLADAYGRILALQEGIQDALNLLDGGNATEEQLQALRDLRDGE